MHSPLIHTLHKQQDFAQASPLGRYSGFLDTTLQHRYHSLPKDLAEKLGISQPWRRAVGKTDVIAYGLINSVHISKQQLTLS